jgi:transcription termination factor NusB
MKSRIEGGFNKLEGLVKNLPGYKGYKEKEVRREADKLLRVKVARALEEQRQRLNSILVTLTNTGRLDVLLPLDRALMRVQLLIDRVKTASYGYAGLFDAVKVREVELEALYNFDAALLESADRVKALIDAIAAATKDEDVLKAANTLLTALEEINTTFSKRQDAILETPSV